jgi:hypothetical protein
MGFMLSMGVALAQGLVVLTLIQGLYLWTLMRRILRCPANHPIARAFERLALVRSASPASPRHPHLESLGPVVARAQLLASTSGDVGDLSIEERSAFRELGERIEIDFSTEIDLKRELDWSRNRTWRGILEFSTRLFRLLDRWWKGTAGKPEGSAAAKWYLGAEEFVAFEIDLVIQEYMSRITRVLGFLVVAQLMLLGSHIFFPFKERHLQIGLDFFYMSVVIVAALIVLLQIDKNEVLSRVASTTPGRIDLKRELVLKLFFYVVIPLLGLFAAYFPEVGGSLMSWLEPLSRATP